MNPAKTTNSVEPTQRKRIIWKPGEKLIWKPNERIQPTATELIAARILAIELEDAYHAQPDDRDKDKWEEWRTRWVRRAACYFIDIVLPVQLPSITPFASNAAFHFSRTLNADGGRKVGMLFEHIHDIENPENEPDYHGFRVVADVLRPTGPDQEWYTVWWENLGGCFVF